MKKYLLCFFILTLFLPSLSFAARPVPCTYTASASASVSGSTCSRTITIPANGSVVKAYPACTGGKFLGVASGAGGICIQRQGSTCVAYSSLTNIKYLVDSDESVSVGLCDDPASDNSGTDRVTVYWSIAPPPPPPPPAPPTITIISPVPNFSYPPTLSTNPLRVTGTASSPKGIKQVRWERYDGRTSTSYPLHPDGFGIATGTLNWFTDVPLSSLYTYGEIVMTATANNNATAQARMPIRYDILPPTINITYPQEQTYSTSTETIKISGTANDPSQVTRVEWSNDRGGSGNTTLSAFRLGLPFLWSQVIPLEMGVNHLTFVAVDYFGNRSQPVTRDVTREDPCPNPVDLAGEKKMTLQEVRKREGQTTSAEIAHAFCVDGTPDCSQSVVNVSESDFSSWGLRTDYSLFGGKNFIKYLAAKNQSVYSRVDSSKMISSRIINDIKKTYFNNNDIVEVVLYTNGSFHSVVGLDINNSLDGFPIFDIIDTSLNFFSLGGQKLGPCIPIVADSEVPNFTGKEIYKCSPSTYILYFATDHTDKLKKIRMGNCSSTAGLCDKTVRERAEDVPLAFSLSNFAIPQSPKGVCSGWSHTILDLAYLVNFTGIKKPEVRKVCASDLAEEKVFEDNTAHCTLNQRKSYLMLTLRYDQTGSLSVYDHSQCAYINRETKVSSLNIPRDIFGIKSITKCDGSSYPFSGVGYSGMYSCNNDDSSTFSTPSSAFIATTISGTQSTSRNTTPSTATLNQALPLEVNMANNSFVDWKAGEIFLKPLASSYWHLSLPETKPLTFLDSLSRLLNMASAILSGTPSLTRIPLTEDVASGDIASFRFNLKSTQLGIRDIQFQLVDKQGKAFGDQTPIFRFTVTATPVTEANATYEGWSVNNTPLIKATADITASVTEYQRLPVSVKMKNTGTSDWNQNNHYLKIASHWLAFASSTDGVDPAGRILLPQATVKAGETTTFTFFLTVPKYGNPNPSLHNIAIFQPQMYKGDLATNATDTPFGQPTPKMTINILPKQSNAQYDGWSVDASPMTKATQDMTADVIEKKTMNLSIKLTNTGNTDWLPTTHFLHLAPYWNPQSYTGLASPGNLKLSQPIKPAQSTTFLFSITVPPYNSTDPLLQNHLAVFQPQMMEGTKLFGQATPKLNINIKPQTTVTPPPAAPRLPAVTITPTPLITPVVTSRPVVTPKPIITPVITPIITPKPPVTTPTPTPSIWLKQPKAGETWHPGDNYIVWGHKNFTGSETVTVKATLTVGGQRVTGDIGTAPIKAGYLKYNLTNTQITGSADITACAQGTCSQAITITVSQAQSLKQQSLYQVANILQTMTEMIKSWR